MSDKKIEKMIQKILRKAWDYQISRERERLIQNKKLSNNISAQNGSNFQINKNQKKNIKDFEEFNQIGGIHNDNNISYYSSSFGSFS